MKSFEQIPFGLRIENVITAYVQYIVKTLWPQDLAVYYPFPPSIPLWQVIFSLLVLILISAATIWAWRRHPYLAVGWFWFLVTLTPVIGLIQVGRQSMADRYTYIPLTGLFVMAAWGVPALTRNLRNRQGILVLLAGTVIIASAAATWQQLGYWRDSLTLFRHAVHVTANNDIAHNNLGIALVKKGDLDGAIKEFQEALAIAPNFILARENLGRALTKKGDFNADLDAAINEYRLALTLAPDNFQTHNNLGVALARKGDLDAAIKEFQEALTLNPNFSQARSNLEKVLAKKRMHN